MAVAVMALTLIGAGTPSPVRADDAAVGMATLQGDAQTPPLPCTPPHPGADTCEGTWEGRFVGTFTGSHEADDGRGVPWWVVVSAPGRASLEYAEPAPADACGPAVVQVQATFAGGVGEVFGLYDSGGPIPRSVVAIRLWLNLEWQHTDLSGPLAVTRLRMEFEVYGLGRITVIDQAHSVSVNNAAAAFAPNDSGACVVSTPAVLDGMLSGTLSSIVASAN